MNDRWNIAAAALCIALAAPAAAQGGLSQSLQRMDRNGDGKVSPEEWAADKPALLKRLDANRDGAISTDEAKSFYQNSADANDPRVAKRIAGVVDADANGDGKATLEELNAAAAADFKRRDRSGDGFLTGDDAK